MSKDLFPNSPKKPNVPDTNPIKTIIPEAIKPSQEVPKPKSNSFIPE